MLISGQSFRILYYVTLTNVKLYNVIVYMAEDDSSVKYFVTRLVDSWNVGIKTGYIKGETSPEPVKKYMSSVGIVVYLSYNWHDDRTKFIMVKKTENTIPNPITDVNPGMDDEAQT